MSLNPNVLTSREIVPPPHNTAWPSVAEKGLGVASEMLALVELVSNSNQPSKVLLSSIPKVVLGDRLPQAVAHAAAGAAELQDEALLFKRAQITFCRGVGHLAEFLYLVVGDVAVLTQVSDDFIEVCLTFTAAGGYSAG